jgi:hypothetical protein
MSHLKEGLKHMLWVVATLAVLKYVPVINTTIKPLVI